MEWAFDLEGPSPLGDEVRRTTGAIVAGRRWYDVASSRYDGVAGIYGGEWSGPVFVLTHHPDVADETVTFLDEGVESAVGTASAAAGEKNVEIFGADVARQCIEAGLLDEIVVHVAPLLLGDGVRLYGESGAHPVKLERVELEEAGQPADMRFRVVNRHFQGRTQRAAARETSGSSTCSRRPGPQSWTRWRSSGHPTSAYESSSARRCTSSPKSGRLPARRSNECT